MSRIEPVGTPWLDAGIVSFSTIAEKNKGEPLYKKNRKEWEKWFPVDFITEGFPGQFKNWFYSLIAMSAVLENKIPTKTILGHEDVFAEDGRAMHKSWGNAIEFNEGAKQIGVDVMRWMYTRQNPADKLLFGYKTADEVRRKFLLKIWNVYNFFVTYANLDGWEPSRSLKLKAESLNILDTWIISRLDETVLGVTSYLEKYNSHHTSVLIEEFVDDLSNWYVRRSRVRLGVAAQSDEDKKAFFETIHFILITLSKLLAPFTPFISEVIYKNLTKEESVHLSEWPERTENGEPACRQAGRRTENVMVEMELVRKICELGHAERKNLQLPVRQPLLSIEVVSLNKKLSKELLGLIKDELNIKKVIWKKGKKLSVKLDTKITLELEQEAKTRQLIRKIQNERKKLGFGLKQEAVVVNPWLPNNMEFLDEIKKITLARKLQKGEFSVRKFS
jgi:isoleucyl-tRNA synthetase